MIMTAADVKRALHRIAHHITDHNEGAHGLVLVGIRTRGVPLARRLAALIAEFEDVSVPVGELDIALYRDDLTLRRGVSRTHRTDVGLFARDLRWAGDRSDLGDAAAPARGGLS